MNSKTGLDLKNETSLKTKTTLILKIAAAVGILGLVVTAVFFIINYFGTPKTSMAEDVGSQTTDRTLIISELAFNGHLGTKNDKYIELHNFTDQAIDLSSYSIVFGFERSASSTITLSGTIPANDFFVIALINERRSQPSSNLSYDYIVPNPGLKMVEKAYVELLCDNIIIDNAGSATDLVLKNTNYDRTDFLSEGITVSSDWTVISNQNTTPGAINFSDSPDIKPVSEAGTAVEFGANSDIDPAISIKPQGNLHPGNVSVKVKRGKEPDAPITMIKRSVDIEPTTQPDNVELVFHYLPSELNGLLEENLALYSYYDGEWHYVGGVVDVENNKITASGVNHFSEWSAGNKQDGVLPISLITFEGEYVEQSVNLLWKTATEENNDYFSIERSQDGLEFEEFSTLSGAGNSNQVIEYQLTDNEPFDGLTYYRLKQTDYDGKFEYFPAIAVRGHANSNHFIIEQFGPNPFKNEVNILFSSDVNETALIKLFDIQGALVKTIEYQCQIGQNKIVLSDLESIANGTYLIHVSTDSHASESIRLIKN